MVTSLSESMVQTLEKLPLMRHTRTESLEILATYMQVTRVREGEKLFSWGMPAETLYVTLSGDYLMAFPDGSSFTLHGSGQIIGMNAILNQGRYTAKAIALTNGSLMVLYRASRDKMLEDHPRFGERIQHSIQAYFAQRRSGKNSDAIVLDEDADREIF